MNDTKPHRMPMELWSMLPSQLQGDVIGGIAKQGRFFQKKKVRPADRLAYSIKVNVNLYRGRKVAHKKETPLGERGY